jgi:lysyl-tRNA synthetase class 2
LFPVNNFSSNLIENFDEKKEVIIAGRIMSRRIQGNASFAEIQDSKGRIQVYFNRDEICKSGDKKKV